MRPVVSINGSKTDVIYPDLPELPDGASEDLSEFHDGLTTWYETFIKVLRRDRDEILAKINNLS